MKLLRVLQEKEVQRVGDSKPIKIDVRIISATNRSLIEEVANGSFREDMFYRLAVAIIRLPALRDRKGDLTLHVDHHLEKINDDAAKEQPGYKRKKISANAKNIIFQQKWPGNVRELKNTLQRAAVWNDEEVIDEETIRSSILNLPANLPSRDLILDRAIDQPIDLQEILNEVTRHYIKRGMEITHGNKTKTASLLGFSSHQTLVGWMKRSGID